MMIENQKEKPTALEEIVAGYKGGKEVPLAGYATLVGVYNAGFAAMLLARRIQAESFPRKSGPRTWC